MESSNFNTSTFQKQLGMLRERYAGLKKALLLYCCKQVWMKNGGWIPWSAAALCETWKISWPDGKTPYERRLSEPFKGPIIPFGSMVEYQLISAKDLSRLVQFSRKVLPGIFLGYV